MRHVHAVRAETDQQVQDHLRVRVAFLREVVRDPRTETLFALWADKYGLVHPIDHLTPILDQAAARAGFADRSVFRSQRSSTTGLFIPVGSHTLVDALSATMRVPVLNLMALLDELLVESRPVRLHQAVGFVVAELYGTTIDEAVPIRAWLAEDLVTIFDEMVACRVYGTAARLVASTPDRIPPDVSSGRRGKRSGPSLEDYGRWVYGLDVADPRTTEEALALERLARLGNPPRAARDWNDITERVDTKLIRYGYQKGKRLLELTVPPERWTAYFADFGPDRRGNIST
jgi:hypothetical protein